MRPQFGKRTQTERASTSAEFEKAFWVGSAGTCRRVLKKTKRIPVRPGKISQVYAAEMDYRAGTIISISPGCAMRVRAMERCCRSRRLLAREAMEGVWRGAISGVAREFWVELGEEDEVEA